ncbi:6-phosphogluconolactonase [Pancytospora philotis]|nr:6-phosphogluconolactonase [Pancytospora philotis]
MGGSATVVRTGDFSQALLGILAKFDGRSCNLMISGGSLLTCLDSPAYADMDCSKWRIFFADERADPRCRNFSDAQKFLGRIRAEAFPIPADLSGDEAAREYERTVRAHMRDGPIDVCLLGVGENGHICSLWPDAPELQSEELVVPAMVDCPLSPIRITVTLRFLNSRVARLFFVIPPKNGKPKSVAAPHCSIADGLTLDYTVVLPEA